MVGRRGTGKTDFIKSVINSTQLPKTLIVDTFDNPPWRNMKTHSNPEGVNRSIQIMEIQNLSRWNKGVFRFFSKDRHQLFTEIEANSWDTLIVFEDATKYIKRTLSPEINDLIIDSKQKNLDLIFVFHSLTAVPPDLVRAADLLTLFKTADGKVSLEKYPWAEIPHMMDHLRKSSNRFENITIQLQ